MRLFLIRDGELQGFDPGNQGGGHPVFPITRMPCSKHQHQAGCYFAVKCGRSVLNLSNDVTTPAGAPARSLIVAPINLVLG
jgi:hypothetical protein